MDGFRLEWQHWYPQIRDKDIVTVYFGGGTPYLLGPERISEILSWIPNKNSLHEITLEANPEDISLDQITAYKNAGINRISLGVQSLDNTLLKRLSRNHTAQQAIQSIDTIINAQISNISIDLMYDLPGQTEEIWKHTIQEAIKLPITHLSLYNLTIEPHTVFFKYRKDIEKDLPDDKTSLAMYEMALDWFPKHELMQYEISAFCKSGFQAIHNSGYWTGRPFLGFGPSAFSYWNGIRFRNIANLSKYVRNLSQGNSPIDFSEKLEPMPALRELLSIRLRLCEGVDLDSFQEQFGQLDEETGESVQMCIKQGLIQLTASQLRLTALGRLFYDTVAEKII